MKRKNCPSSREEEEKRCSRHEFSDEEQVRVRSSLLAWYDKHSRTLPWRSAALEVNYFICFICELFSFSR